MAFLVLKIIIYLSTCVLMWLVNNFLDLSIFPQWIQGWAPPSICIPSTCCWIFCFLFSLPSVLPHTIHVHIPSFFSIIDIFVHPAVSCSWSSQARVTLVKSGFALWSSKDEVRVFMKSFHLRLNFSVEPILTKKVKYWCFENCSRVL